MSIAAFKRDPFVVVELVEREVSERPTPYPELAGSEEHYFPHVLTPVISTSGKKYLPCKKEMAAKKSYMIHYVSQEYSKTPTFEDSSSVPVSFLPHTK